MKIKYIITALVFICFKSIAQSTFYNGGSLFSQGVSSMTNSSNQNILAPTNYLWSVANFSSSTNVGYGGANSIVLADRFTIPAGENWNVNFLEFFAYQNNNTNLLPISSLFVQIWSSDPAATNPVLVFGDTQTNVLNSNSIQDYFMYRVGVNAPSTTKKINSFKANINTQLVAGQYWISWSWISNGSIFFPDYQLSTGVAKYKENGVWTSLIDPSSGGKSKFPFGIGHTNTLGIQQNLYDNQIKVLPNPISDDNKLLINTDLNNDLKSVEICNLNGVTLLTETLNKLQPTFEISTINLKSGIYLVKILNNNNQIVYTKKLIKI